jgi:uncharacterized protein YndB with AHSA1/START domain
MSGDQIVAHTEMLIRKPVAEVFQAFVDPAVTSKFWFTKGSGRLEPGSRVRWDWAMYGFHADVDVKQLEPDRRIVIAWSSPGEAPTTVEWTFRAHPRGTVVSITNSGFRGEDVARLAIGATEGFAFVLAAAKALLEHGIQLQLVADRHPDGLPGPER